MKPIPDTDTLQSHLVFLGILKAALVWANLIAMGNVCCSGSSHGFHCHDPVWNTQVQGPGKTDKWKIQSAGSHHLHKAA